MRADLRTSVVTKKVSTLRLVRKDIIDLINKVLPDMAVPDNADVTVQVPGGGDWSNTTLDLDLDNPVIVRWTQTETEGDTDD